MWRTLVITHRYHRGRGAAIRSAAVCVALCRRRLGAQVRHVEHEAVEGHRLCEQESLPEPDAEGADTLALILRFDPFGRIAKFSDLVSSTMDEMTALVSVRPCASARAKN
jgi:hypothetical protein